MINKEIILRLFNEEIKDLNLKIPPNIDKDKLENHFLKFLEVDIYDWFKSNFNNYLSEQISSDWRDIKSPKTNN